MNTKNNSPYAGNNLSSVIVGRFGLVLLLSTLLLLAVFGWTLGHPTPLRAADPVRYVSVNTGTDDGGANTCAYFYDPCRTIQQAIDQADTADEIRVAAGTYSTVNTEGGETQVVYLDKSLTLQGGYTTTNWITPDPDQNPTIIDAGSISGRRAVYVPSSIAATINGFHLTGGLLGNRDGAGLYNPSGNITLENNKIYGNQINASSSNYGGGGVANSTGSITLINNDIYNNTVQNSGGLGWGGGVNTGSGGGAGDAILEGNRIYGNSADDIGGGIVFNAGNSLALRNNMIYNNTATNSGGGGLALSNGLVSSENDTFYDNTTGANGGGLWAFDGTLVMTNSLVISNTAVNGGGIYSQTDTIGSALSIDYANFYGNTADQIEGPGGAIALSAVGSNNVSTNPQFADAGTYDLHLTTASPRDDGLDLGLTTDYEGQPRPYNSGVDRGADEYVATGTCYARLEDGQLFVDNPHGAINAATGGDTIQLAGYCALAQTIQLTKSLTLRGGYTLTDWVNQYYGPAVLDGQGSVQVINAFGLSSINIRLEHLHITGGNAVNGGGVYLGDKISSQLYNNIIEGNTASTNGGGLYSYGVGTADVQHNTIINNTGGGVYAYRQGVGVLTLRSNIIANNTGYGIDGVSGTLVNLGYNDLYNNSSGNYSANITAGTTDISVNPQLSADFHAPLASGVVNAADPDSSVTLDFDGNNRPVGDRADIGADESLLYARVQLADSADSPAVITTGTSLPTSIIFYHVITNLGNTGSANDTINITANNSDGWTATPLDTPVTLQVGQTDTIRVQVDVPFIADPTGLYNETVVTATSTTNENGYDIATDYIAFPGMEFSPNHEESHNPAEVFTYTHTLRNLGPPDTFTLSLVSSRNWGSLLSPANLTLAHNESAQVLVQVDVPTRAGVSVQDYITVTAESSFGITKQVTDVTTILPIPGDRYVADTSASPQGNDTDNNCQDPNFPCLTVNYALVQAGEGDDIYIAKGTYPISSSLTLNQNTSLYGNRSRSNFAATPNFDTLGTTIEKRSGSGTFAGIIVSAADPADVTVEGLILDGFTFGAAGGGIQVRSTANPTLKNLIIRNTQAPNGAGIGIIQSAGPTLRDIAIEDTTASDTGGGLYIDTTGSPSLENISIHNATAGGVGGGGLYVSDGAIDIQNLSITATQASRGTGIYMTNGSIAWDRGSIYSTTATSGAGIYLTDGTLTAQKLRIWQNHATGSGGGAYQAGGTLTITQSHFYNNTATQGGGLYSANGQLNLWNNNLYWNEASGLSSSSGGAIYKNAGTLTVLNNTLYQNQATYRGGGLFDRNSGSLVFSNTLVVDNQASQGSGLYRASLGTLSLAYNDFWNNTSNITLDSTNISADPGFADPVAGDFHLDLDSPAVDQGDPNSSLTDDIEGDLRPSGQGFDIGADEVGGCLARVVDATGPQTPVGILQTAIDQAPDSAVIQIHGTCRGVVSRQVGGQWYDQTALITKSLTLKGGYNNTFSNDPDIGTPLPTILDARGQGRVVAVRRTGVDIPSVEIFHLTLTGGDASGQGGGPSGADAGGGIYNYNSSLQIENSVITNNQATYGGGIYHRTTLADFPDMLVLGDDTGANPTEILNNSATYGGGLYIDSNDKDPRFTYLTVGQNEAINRGGGLYLANGTLVINNSQFNQNTANSNQGGGLYNAGTLAISYTDFYSNTANAGGGIYNTTTLEGHMLTMAQNSAAAGGGAINNPATLFLERSTIYSNTATAGSDGGGLYNTGDLTLLNTIVAYNEAIGGGVGTGGGLYNQSDNMILRHDTFYGNQAESSGGGIFHDGTSSAPIINSSFIVNNDAPSGGGIQNASTAPTFQYNDVVNNTAANYGGLTPDSTNMSATPTFISTDPTDPQFLRINPGSNGEEDGDPASPITIDIDGGPRPANQNFDIGVDEVGSCYVRINGLLPTYGKIQVAIDNSQPGDEIRVAGNCPGVTPISVDGEPFTQSIVITKSLTIRGGYQETNFQSSDPINFPTIIDAQNEGRTVLITGTGQVTIAGLHLYRGNADLGGGQAGDGGAILVGGNPNLVLTEMDIYSNTATRGGALYANGGTVNIYEEVYTSTYYSIYENQATEGGAFYNDGAIIIPNRLDIHHNTATTSGGAFYHNGGISQLRNNILRQNNAPNGGAIYNASASGLEVWHNTFYNNTASGEGGSLYNAAAGVVDTTVLNNIFYDSQSSGHSILYSTASMNIQYNNIYADNGATRWNSNINTPLPTTIITADPILQGPTIQNFHIADNSPVIDAGYPDMELFSDFEGDYRPGDQNFDMGADETSSCWAQVWRSGSAVSPIYGNVQIAINNSQAGDEIRVTRGVCAGVHLYNGTISQTVHITHDLTIRGSYYLPTNGLLNRGGNTGPGPYPSEGSTTFDPMGLGRAVLVTNNADVVLERLILVNGDAGASGDPTNAGGGLYADGPAIQLNYVDIYSSTADMGGAFYHAGGTASMHDNRIRYNQATDGGAIYNESGSLSISDQMDTSNIFSNTATSRGGGIFNNSGSELLLTEVVVLRVNTANQGGFLYNSGAASLAGATIYENNASTEGGAIYNSGQLTTTFVVIRNNEAVTVGGGVYNSGTLITKRTEIHTNDASGGTGQGGAVYMAATGVATIEVGSQLYNNEAYQGGALYLADGGSLALHNSLIYDNSSLDRAGGLYIRGGTPEILHNTFYNNIANGTGQGGAIYIFAGSPLIERNIFLENKQQTSDNNALYVTTSGTPSLDYNDYWPSDTDQLINVSSGPNDLFVDPTLDDPAGGNFHLLNGSPLIDVIPFTTGDLDHDFENGPRPVNTGSDIGADEYNACLAQAVEDTLLRGSEAGPVFGTISEALAYPDYEEIRVAEGICYENVLITDPGTIIDGSWEKNFSEWVEVDGVRQIRTTVSGQNNGSPVFSIDGTATSTRLSYMELIDGNSSNGGAIFNGADGLSLSYLHIHDSSADSNGGALYIVSGSGSTSLSRMTIYSNTAKAGGGIYVEEGNTLNVSASSINDNQVTSGGGGGLYVTANSTATLSVVDMSRNEASASNGGAIYNDGRLVSSGGTFGSNIAGVYGGGIYLESGSYGEVGGGSPISYSEAEAGGGVYVAANAHFVLEQKQINRNTASSGHGGGIFAASGSVLTLTNLGLYGNTTSQSGGGLYQASGSQSKLYHATIHENEAVNNGGGVHYAGSAGGMVISASIVAFNTASTGPNVNGSAQIYYTLRWPDGTYNGVSLDQNPLVANPQILYSSGELHYTSPAIDAVPSDQSDVTVDRMLDPRPLLCAHDAGRDEHAVGKRAITVFGPSPTSALLNPLESVTYTFSLRNDSEHWIDYNDSDTSLGPGTGYTETLSMTVYSDKDVSWWGELIDVEGGSNVVSETASYPHQVLANVGPGQRITLTVAVTVPAGTSANTTERLWVHYEAQDCPDYTGKGAPTKNTESAQTTVRENFQFEIGPPQTGAALPGQSITYTFHLTNTGNQPDTYSIYPNPILYATGHIVRPTSVPPQVTLNPNESALVKMRVDINAEAAGGLTDITYVVAQSEDSPDNRSNSVESTTYISYSNIITRYVAIDGNDSLVDESVVITTSPNVKDNNCTKPTGAPPCRTIQQALNQGPPGVVVKIAAGTYTSSFTATYQAAQVRQGAFITKPASLMGGYLNTAAGWNQVPPDHVTNTTALAPTQGRPVLIDNSSGTFTGPVLIDRLILDGNNGSTNDGDLIYNDGADLTLHNNRLMNGQGSQGGAVYHQDGELTLKNNLVHDNQASGNGGALYIQNGTQATLQNNTFYNNQATGGQGGAVYINGNNLIANGNIFDTNTAGGTGDAIQVGGGSATLDYNLYDSSGQVAGASTGSNAVIGDPQFANTGFSPPNLHLQVTSPAVSQGDPGVDVNTYLVYDYDNNLRQYSLPLDIGAYEWRPIPNLEFAPDHTVYTDTLTVFTLTHVLTNTGNYTDIFTIDYQSNLGWATMDVSTIEVAANMTASVVVTITAGLPGEIDDTVITATSKYDPQVYATVTDRTIVTFNPGVDLEQDQTGATKPSEPITYTLTLTNTGDGQDTFDLTYTVPPSWTVAISPEADITLSQAESISIVVVITPPTGTISGTAQTIIVTATNQYVEVVSDTVAITTTILPVYGLSLVQDEAGGAESGQSITYTHRLTNLSNFTHTVNLTFTTSPSWPVSLDPISLNLGARKGVTVTVIVTVPSGAPAGEVNTTYVTASLVVSDVSAMVVDTTTANAQPGVDIEPDRSGQAQPGETITYSHILTNTGNTTDTITISTLQTAPGDPVFPVTIVSGESVTLSAGSTAPVTVAVTVPPGTLSGTIHTLRVIATSGIGPSNPLDYVVDTTTVSRQRAVQLVPDGYDYALSGSLVYTHTLTNIGNAPDTFDLSYLNTNGWTVSLDPTGPVTLNAGDSTLITATVDVGGGDPVAYTYITATVQGEPTISDTVVDTGERSSAPRPSLIAPPNNHITDTSSVELAWSYTGVPSYTLDLNGTLYTITNIIAGPVVSQTDALGEGIYTWTVASIEPTTGYRGTFTDTWQFIIDLAPPSTPTPITPVNQIVLADPVQFTWGAATDSGAGVLSYTLTITDETGLPQNHTVGNITSTAISLGTDGVYTWTIQAIDGAGKYSALSASAVFTLNTTLPPMPTLIAPADGTITNSQAIVLEWSQVSQALSYTLYLTPEGTFQFAGPGPSPVISPTTLSEGVYTWTVEAVDEFGRASGHTQSWNFTIDTTPPATPTLISPTNGAIVDRDTSTFVTFEWSAATGADGYHLSITKSPTQSTVIDSTTPTQTVELLFGNGVYTWMVEAYDLAGNVSGYTDPWTFTLTAPPPRPQLIAPPDGTVTSSNNITLDWSAVADAITYTLYLTGPTGQTITPTNATDYALSLPDDGIYTWTVEAENDLNKRSGITDTWNFIIDTTPPASPTLSLPAQGSLVPTNTVTFSWNPATDTPPGVVVSYTIRVYSTTATYSATVSAETAELTLGSDGVYSWTVEAIDAAGNISLPSDPFTFTIDTSGPQIPTLIAPPDGTITNTLPIELVWSRELNAISYTLYLTDSLGAMTPYEALQPATGSVVSQQLTGLADGVYTWTVEAFGSNGQSKGITDTWRFTLDTGDPTTPNPLSPLSATIVTTSTVPFQWEAATDSLSGVVSYTVIVTGPTSVQSDTVGLTDTTISLVDGDGTYTWTVVAIDAAGNVSPVGDPITFSVDANPPERPTLIAPPDGTITNTASLDLAWSQVAQAISYTAHITDELGSVTTYDTLDTGTDPVIQSVSLASEGYYTWTVEAFDNLGRSSGLTDTWSLVIDRTDPDTPVTGSPPDSSVLLTNTVTFTWSPVNDNFPFPISYTVIVTGPTGVFSVTVRDTTSTTLTLNGDGVYTWTIRATDPAGNSSTSSPSTFIVDAVPPLPPTLIAPANESLTNTDTISFRWSQISDAISYTLHLTPGGAFGIPGPGSDPVVSATILADGFYSWTVEAHHYGQSSMITDTWVFTVDTIAPSPFSLVKPANNSVLTASLVSLEWTASTDERTGPVVYTVLAYGRQQLYTQTVTGVTATGIVLPDDIYTWTVRASDGAGNMTYADVFTLEVDAQPPKQPELIYPPDNHLTNTTTIPFQWLLDDTGPMTYTLTITGPAGLQGHFTTNQTTLTETLTQGDGVYLWTVSVTDRLDRRSYTGTHSLTLDTIPPTPPALISPPDGTITTATRFTFTWSTVLEIDSPPAIYTIDIGNVGRFDVGTNTFFLPTTALSLGSYTWTVYAADQAGNTQASSDIFSFTIEEKDNDVYLPIIMKVPFSGGTATPTATATATPTGTRPATSTPTSTPTPTTTPIPKPDLVIDSIELINCAGSDCTVRVQASNISDTPVAFGNNFYVNIYIDPSEPFLDNKPLPVKQDHQPPLSWGVQASWFGAHQTVTLEKSHTFTSTTPTLYGWIDPYQLPNSSIVGTVDEANEANNGRQITPTLSGVSIEAAPAEPRNRQPVGLPPTPTLEP